MLAGQVYAKNLINNEHARVFRSFVETFFSELSSEVEKGVKAVDKELLRYQQAITSGSTGGDSIRTRINILTKRLATFSPLFANMLGAHNGATDEVRRNIGELAAGIRDLFYEINRRHSATYVKTSSR